VKLGGRREIERSRGAVDAPARETRISAVSQGPLLFIALCKEAHRFLFNLRTSSGRDHYVGEIIHGV